MLPVKCFYPHLVFTEKKLFVRDFKKGINNPFDTKQIISFKEHLV